MESGALCNRLTKRLTKWLREVRRNETTIYIHWQILIRISMGLG